ncbi:MAG: DUF58 domain-containing protein [Myxococcota bacterium]
MAERAKVKEDEPSISTPSVIQHKFSAGPRLAPLALAGTPVALLDGGSGLGLLATLSYDAALLVGGALEARRLRRSVPTAVRSMDARLVVGIPNTITVQLHNPSSRAIKVLLRDELPAGWEADPAELRTELRPFARKKLAYEVKPPQRGRFEFGDLHLRLDGFAGLGASIVTVAARAEAKVYPNVLGPKRYEMAARLGDLRHAGFRSVRMVGGGGEFEQLREYVSGDSYKDVDWKSTAKRKRPITRVYQQERSQQILIAVDAGRTMATRLDDIAKVDHAINAALLLAFVALRQGDRVGLVVFSDVVRSFVAPGRGPGQYRKILEALFSVQAEMTYVDFRRFVEFVRLRVPRRALLVLFSDLLDETHAAPLADHLAILRRKHLPLCVTMRDPVARELSTRPVSRAMDVYERAAAADILAERERTKAALQKNAVQLVEADAGQLSVAAVNRYIEIKAKHRL